MVKINEGVVRPELLLQLLSRHNFPCTIEQDAKNHEGLTLQAESPTVPSQLTRRKIELEVSKPSLDSFGT
jgi:hypothetical protein